MRRCEDAERVWENLDSRRCEDAKMRRCGSPQNICRPNATKMRRCVVAKMRDIGYVHPALLYCQFQMCNLLKINFIPKWKRISSFCESYNTALTISHVWLLAESLTDLGERKDLASISATILHQSRKLKARPLENIHRIFKIFKTLRQGHSKIFTKYSKYLKLKT